MLKRLTDVSDEMLNCKVRIWYWTSHLYAKIVDHLFSPTYERQIAIWLELCSIHVESSSIEHSVWQLKLHTTLIRVSIGQTT